MSGPESDTRPENTQHTAPSKFAPLVLVTEDDPSSRELLVRRVAAAGYEVASASCGSECREFLSSKTPDAILLDICLPDATGLELLNEIRTRWSQQQLPVLLVTALSEDEDVLRGLAAGANDYVVKPVNASVLMARLSVNLKLKAAVSDLESRIQERTEELRATNAELKQEIAIRQQRENELKQKQEQLIQSEKMRSLGILASGIAHEVNNPNHVILSSANSLSRILDESRQSHQAMSHSTPDPDTARNLLATIERSGKRIQRIVQELKSYSGKSEPGGLKETSVNDVVESAITLLRKHIRSSTANFELNLYKENLIIKGDYVRLEQVIINLIQNACQSLASSEQKISVSTGASSTSAHIEVCDSGEGISIHDLPRLTDPFFTTRRGDGGTGLGLSICETIVQEHGGKMEFSSDLGKGTCVRVVLPRTVMSSDGQESDDNE